MLFPSAFQMLLSDSPVAESCNASFCPFAPSAKVLDGVPEKLVTRRVLVPEPATLSVTVPELAPLLKLAVVTLFPFKSKAPPLTLSVVVAGIAPEEPTTSVPLGMIVDPV